MTPKLNKWLTTTVDTYDKYFGSSSAPVIYEVGSRDGKDGFELALRIYDGHDLWKDSKIVLFECNPPQIEVIQQSYPQAILIQNAISDKPGIVEFMQIHGDQDMMGSSTLDTKRNDSWIKETTTIKVEARRLDSVIEELGHQNTEIDIMKIDIEHFTAEALRSLGKYLQNVKVFHLETEPPDRARAENNLDIALFMEQKGYKCTALEHEWGETIQDQVWYRLPTSKN